MNDLKVNEFFYSLQGEGRRSGEPSIFIRLAGCDLTCGFCDTEFESGGEFSPAKIVEMISGFPGKWIVWTGGEPSLQLRDDHIAFFKAQGYSQAIETNGNNRVPAGLDWVVCSPKVAEHIVAKNFPEGVDELRYVRHKNQIAAPEPKVKARVKYISPMFDGDQINEGNLRKCVEIVLANPEWRLSLQTHKLIRVL